MNAPGKKMREVILLCKLRAKTCSTLTLQQGYLVFDDPMGNITLEADENESNQQKLFIELRYFTLPVFTN